MNRLKPPFLNALKPLPMSQPPAQPTTTKSYNAIINHLSSEGAHRQVLLTYASMLKTKTPPDTYTFPSLLKACTFLNLFSLGLSFHQLIVVNGYFFDAYIGSSLINLYVKFGHAGIARKVFDMMPERNVVPWTAIIGCYSRLSDVDIAFSLFDEMRYQGIQPSSVTLLSMLSGVSELVHVKWLQLLNNMRTEGMRPDQQTIGSMVSVAAIRSDLKLGKSVHGQILRAGLDFDAHVETSLIVMYLKSGNIDIAFRIFESNKNKDVVLWTAMISGLVQNQSTDKALVVFRQMLESRVEPSTATMASVLSACAQLGSFDLGTSNHAYMLRHAVGGYAQNGHLCQALFLFNEMRANLQRPDSITIVSLLQGCATTGALHQGKWLHSFVTRSNLRPCILVDTALVDMYCKCGDLDTAQKCFNGMAGWDLVSWGAIIAGYGCHGKGETALRLYSEFLQTGIKPNHVIFLSVLSSCSHNGLIDQGLNIYHSMTKDFGIAPNLEHHACVVDLLCRAGRVEEAYSFYTRVFPEPVLDVLGILLDSCRANGNDELGESIAGGILKLRPNNAGNYVQLVHCYAAMNKWGGVGEAWSQMRSLGLRKLPGWSFIELHGTIATFFTDHNSHSQYEEIVSTLKILRKEMGRKEEIEAMSII
ncbi:Pentatricopeptide repeat-containing protein [Quillaja saponaria]|uniref:Pentatricopeptide repeat-containing protein n=1 Tax=Quillaja saponaria TaxID=32244 RepID=A0AAD7KV34_QUISA|nr:Pentatricopeptide repeat-containing protein [Quillaja saponaria]